MTGNPSIWPYVAVGFSVAVSIFGFALLMQSTLGMALWSHDNPVPQPDIAAVGRACMGGDQGACQEYPVVKDAAAAWRSTVPDHPEWEALGGIGMNVLFLGVIGAAMSWLSFPLRR